MPPPRSSTSLQLAYALVTTPNVIQASAKGANPNGIDLQVIISNPSLGGPNVGKIQIEIPIVAVCDADGVAVT